MDQVHLVNEYDLEINSLYVEVPFSPDLRILHIHFLDTLKSFGLPWWHSG